MALTKWAYYYRLPPSATLNQFTQIGVSPLDLIFEDVKDRERVFYRRALRTEFSVYGDDYETLETLRAASLCDDIDFLIYYDGGEVWAGKIKLRRAKWFPDECRVSFTPDVEDSYTCLFRNWEKEKNILSLGTPVSVEPFYGTLTEVTCGPVNQSTPIEVLGYFETNVNACLADQDAYTLKRAYIEEITPGSSYDHYATYVTEQVTLACSGGSPVPPPGDGWVLLVDDCAGSGNATYGRPVQVAYAGEKSATSGKYWDSTFDVIGEDVTIYGNGIKFSDIVADFADDCGLTVVSDFFGINGDATAPANAAYTASAALASLVVFQKSDVKRPDAGTPATLAYLKFRDLLSILKTMFNVEWRIEGTDFRIEHISYYAASNGEDLTSTQTERVSARNAYTYDEDSLAPAEEFYWGDNTYDADFRGLAIRYAQECSDPEQEAAKYTAVQSFTDLGTIISTPDSVSDEGFFWMATDLISGTYYLNREYGELSNDIKPNAHLAWANLHENYHTWGRLQITGNLNNVDQTFDSARRSRRQQEVTVVYSPTDYFALDMTEKLKTALGWGEITKGTYSALRCEYTIELLHDD